MKKNKYLEIYLTLIINVLKCKHKYDIGHIIHELSNFRFKI